MIMEKEKELRVKAKRVWNAMRYRCSLKDYGSRTYAYRGVTICEEWMDFECFFEWFKNNYIDGFQIDKDILKRVIVFIVLNIAVLFLLL